MNAGASLGKSPAQAGCQPSEKSVAARAHGRESHVSGANSCGRGTMARRGKISSVSILDRTLKSGFLAWHER